MIADGRLPVRGKSADMKRGKVLINLLALIRMHRKAVMFRLMQLIIRFLENLNHV